MINGVLLCFFFSIILHLIMLLVHVDVHVVGTCRCTWCWYMQMYMVESPQQLRTNGNKKANGGLLTDGYVNISVLVRVKPCRII